MKTRKVFVTTVTVLALVSLEAAPWFYGANRSRICFECYQKIEEGMTREQVEAILGGPPRWEIEAKRPSEEVLFHFVSHWPWPAEWWGTAGVITVNYRKDIVTRKNFKKLPFEPKPPRFWEVVFPWTKKVRTFGGV